MRIYVCYKKEWGLTKIFYAATTTSINHIENMVWKEYDDDVLSVNSSNIGYFVECWVNGELSETLRLDKITMRLSKYQ